MKNRGGYVRKDLGIYTLSNTRTGADLNLGARRVGRVRIPTPGDRARPAGVPRPAEVARPASGDEVILALVVSVG
jgi:hypothetical protein